MKRRPSSLAKRSISERSIPAKSLGEQRDKGALGPSDASEGIRLVARSICNIDESSKKRADQRAQLASGQRRCSAGVNLGKARAGEELAAADHGGCGTDERGLGGLTWDLLQFSSYLGLQVDGVG